MKRFARRIVKFAAFQFSAMLFVLSMSGLLIGRATGLHILNYVPPNLTPQVEIACVVVQQSEAPDRFALPD